MNKLNLLLIAAAVAVTGCSRGAEKAEPTPAEQAAELDKQAEVQAAVGDKAGAEALRAKADALRNGTAAEVENAG